jgi:nucleotide-binding universal stress UspA family protein
MGPEIYISYWGILFAIIFLVSMGSLLRWMFHVPKPIPLAAAKARRALAAVKKIVVPTSGTSHAERGIELACRLGEEQKAEIYLINVLEIPRTLPLEAPIPDAEARAEEILRRGEAIVTLRGLPAQTELRRGRVAGEEIIRAAKDLDADMIVMGIRTEIRMAQEILGHTSNLVLRRASCDVIVGKLSTEGP